LKFIVKQPCYIGQAQVHGRGYDVIGFLPQQLNDVFSQIAFNGGDIMRLEEIVNFDFLGRHGFRFYDVSGTCFFQDRMDLISGFFSVACPDDFSALALKVSFKLRQVFVKVFYHFPLQAIALSLRVFQVVEARQPDVYTSIIFINIIIDNLSVMQIECLFLAFGLKSFCCFGSHRAYFLLESTTGRLSRLATSQAVWNTSLVRFTSISKLILSTVSLAL